MYVYSRSKGFINLIVVFAILFLGALGAGSVYLYRVNKEVIVDLPKKAITATSSPLIRPLVTTKAKYVLEKKAGNKAEELFAVSNDMLLNIVRWNNLLIFSDGGQNDKAYPPNIQIKIHNLDTGKTDVIFDNFKSGSEFRSGKFPDSLSDLQVIGDTLYFSLGGYLKEGAIFWLDLPPAGKPQELVAVRNGSISKLKNWYFVMGGEGDSCWSESDFYLLDTKTKSVRKVVTSKAGCNPGEESLGLSGEGKMIMADHRGDGNSPDGVYTDVTSLDILNPDSKQVIISRDQMPDKITTILYLDYNNQLLLVGKSIYLFDILSNQLSKIVDSPEGVKLYSGKAWQNDKVCFSGERGNENSQYELNISTKQLTKVGRCNFVPSPTPKTTSDFKRLINSLGLPANYQFIEN